LLSISSPFENLRKQQMPLDGLWEARGGEILRERHGEVSTVGALWAIYLAAAEDGAEENSGVKKISVEQ
jgi:hypothetical protein